MYYDAEITALFLIYTIQCTGDNYAEFERFCGDKVLTQWQYLNNSSVYKFFKQMCIN
jgi:hypothetical protein